MSEASNDVGTSFSGTITIGTENESQENRDKVAPILQQIKAREKENQEAVKTLRHLLSKEGKKCIILSMKLENTNKVAGGIAKDNDDIARAIRKAKEDLCKLQQKKPKADDDANQDLDDILQDLKRYLNDLAQDIEPKEKYLKENAEPKENKSTGKSCEELSTLIATKQSELPKMKEKLPDLKAMLKRFYNNLSILLRSRKGEAVEKISDFKTAVAQILKCLDSLTVMKTDRDLLQKKKKDLEKTKKEMHDQFCKRLEARRGLVVLHEKIWRSLKQIEKSCRNCEPLPGKKANLAVHMQEMYDWGCNQLECGKSEVDAISNKLKEATNRANEDDRRKKMRDAVDDEIKDLEDQLKKMGKDNQDLRDELEKLRQDVETNNAKRKSVCGDIRILTQRDEREIIIVKETRQTEIKCEQEKQRTLEESLSRLRESKIRLETELKMLDEEIAAKKRRCAEDIGRERKRRASLEKELSNLK